MEGRENPDLMKMKSRQDPTGKGPHGNTLPPGQGARLSHARPRAEERVWCNPFPGGRKQGTETRAVRARTSLVVLCPTAWSKQITPHSFKAPCKRPLVAPARQADRGHDSHVTEAD